MKFSAGVTALMAASTMGGALAFAPSKVNGVSSSLSSTATETYTFTKSEEIFAEAVEVRNATDNVLFRMETKGGEIACMNPDLHWDNRRRAPSNRMTFDTKTLPRRCRQNYFFNFV